jgi:hypothetical protein
MHHNPSSHIVTAYALSLDFSRGTYQVDVVPARISGGKHMNCESKTKMNMQEKQQHHQLPSSPVIRNNAANCGVPEHGTCGARKGKKMAADKGCLAWWPP